MGLTIGGFALLILLIMLFIGQVGRFGIIIAAIAGAVLPLAGQIAGGASELGASIAPILNTLGGGV